MPKAPSDLAVFTANATQVAGILRALANERRLMILCKLAEWGEATVGSLVDAVGLSQSALSQHLGKLREEGLVATRREAQTIYYRLADERVERLIDTLVDLFCSVLHPAGKKRRR